MVQYPCPWLKGLLLEALKEADFGDYVSFVEVLWRFRVFIRLQALSKACLARSVRLNKNECDRLFKEGLIYGCGKPFKLIINEQENKYFTEKCDYI